MPSSLCVLADVSFHWPDGQPVLEHVSHSFFCGRCGLIGRNGSGKSTLLRLLAGDLVPDGGAFRRVGEVGYIPQTIVLDRCATVAELLGIAPVVAAMRAIASGSADPEHFALVGDRWGIEEEALAHLARLCLLDRLSRRGGDPLSRSVSELSGGEVMAVALAGKLVARPDILLLDEPTNNLDRRGRDWLYREVSGWQGILVAASHDVELLGIMDEIVEVRRVGVRVFGGDYSLYDDRARNEREAVERKVRDAEANLGREKRQRQAAEARNSRKRRAGARDRANSKFPKAAANLRRSRAEASSGKARLAREERLASAGAALRQLKMDAMPDEAIDVALPDTVVPIGKTVLEMTASGRTVSIRGPERIVLGGPNGSGKTSLLRTILGEAALPGVEIEAVVPEVGYLSQRLDFPDESAGVLDTLRLAAPGLSPNGARARLAQFLLKGDGRMDLPAAALSGGERFRLALACLLSASPSPKLLLLDEPTNNLDLASIGELASSLNSYRGALIVASHDRRFLASLSTTRAWEMDNLRLVADRALDCDPGWTKKMRQSRASGWRKP
ncbi:MAG: ATP-binding cassette domain-containing protein [Planctomycetota bacterium]|jgi:ATPase subunit of ABC transporter with duplicated ATPase domains|nr:ATP-binding cassette domain-containing protein [Planctomycetota bacterium]